MPFQRAQAQFLIALDAQDPNHQITLQDAQGDPNQQLEQVEALQADPPAALLLQPCSADLLSASLARLQATGTRILVFDPPEPATTDFSAVETVIECDPFKIGQAAAQITLQALGRRAETTGESTPSGRVLEIRGSDTSPWCSRVHDGFVKGLEAQPGVLLVHDTPADWSPDLVAPRLAEALRLQTAIDVIFAHDDFLAQAAHHAMTQSGFREDTLIIGINGFPGPEGGIEMMRRTEIDATIQRPFLVDHAWGLLKQNTPAKNSRTVAFPPQPILPSDLDRPDGLPPALPVTTEKP